MSISERRCASFSLRGVGDPAGRLAGDVDPTALLESLATLETEAEQRENTISARVDHR